MHHPIVAILGFILFCNAAPGEARDALGERLCVVGSSIDINLDQALKLRGKCMSGQSPSPAPRLWAFVDIDPQKMPELPATLLMNHTDFTKIAIHARYADGRWENHQFDREVMAKNWQAGGRFRVPLSRAEEAPTTIAISFDHLGISPTIRQIELASNVEVAADHYNFSLLFALFLGTMALPAIYSFFLYRAIPERFMVWHAILACACVCHALSASGLIYLIWPDLSANVQRMMTIWTLAIVLLAGAMFGRVYIEKDILKPIARHALVVANIPVLTLTFLVTMCGETVRFLFQPYYFLSFLPAMLVILTVVLGALIKGSRSARYLTVAWGGILLAGLERIMRGSGFYEGAAWFDMLLYYALVFEVTVIALGVADRFMIIRRERDVSKARETTLEKLAESDRLTGLANRRGLERVYNGNADSHFFDHLAIIDIDHFKAINDGYGHEMGDNVLRAFGHRLRDLDLDVARIGGEEFVLLMKDGEDKDVAERVTKICRDLSTTIAKEVPELDRLVTCSAGLARIAIGAPMRGVLTLADQRLYIAKESGCNRVIGEEYARDEKQAA